MLYHLNVFVSIKFKWKIASEHFSDFIGGICTLQWLNAALRWSILGGKLNTWSTGKFCGKRQPLSHAVSWMFLTNLALCQLTVLRLILKGFFSIHLFWFDPHTDLAAFRASNKVHFHGKINPFCLYVVYTFCRDSGNWGKESQPEIYVSFFVLTGYIELNFYICITRLM